MPRYTMPLWIEVDATDAEAAFAAVRTDFCVVNDPLGKIVGSVEAPIVFFEIGEEPTELDDDDLEADPETALDDQDPDMGDCGSDLN